MRRSTSSTGGFLALALAAACTPTPTILPSNDFNRPMDIAFMCLGAFDPDVPGTFDVSGRPMRVCHPPPVAAMRQAQPGAAISSRMYAFVPNSASGDLSVIDGDSWKLVDLDKATGGFGRAPLGSLPEQISASSDGCRLVTANRGSCDLTVVNPSTLLASRFADQYNSDTVSVNVPAGNGIQRVVPMRDDGTPLGAAPYEVVFLPTDTSALTAGNKLCPADGAPGSWHALATFPGCDLVAILDLPSGNIISSAQVVKDASGKIQLTDAGTHPKCLAECGTGRMNGSPDAGTSDPDAGTSDPDAGTSDPDAGTDGGGVGPVLTAARGQYEPTSIAITPRADHAYISLANAPAILSTGLTPSAMTAPQNTVDLHDGAQGSNRIRLGVDPNQYATDVSDFAGKFVGSPDRAYLYVVARDGSLRIIDVVVPGDPAVEVECETNFDPLDPFNSGGLATVPITPDTRCIRYGTVKRRQYSSTATTGLRFPTPVVDVAAADMTSTQLEETVNGGYAWVLTASSSIYLVNITPQQRRIKAVVRTSQQTLFPLTPEDTSEAFVYKNADPGPGLVSESPPFPNRPRDRNVMSYSVSLDPTLGPVRLDVPPTVLLTGPYIEPFFTQGTQDNATSIDPEVQPTFVFFPDRDGALAQGWDVTWQGTIVPPRYSGVIKGSSLRDDGGGFCGAGVLAGDIVTLRGCGSNAECPLGMVCHRDTSLDQVQGGLTVTGLCVSANMPSLESKCAPYVSTLRRYEIVAAYPNALTLKPHLDEIVRSSLTPCRLTGAAGTTGADGGADDGGTGGAVGLDCFDPSDPTANDKKFTCVDIGPQPRCLMECTTDQDCRHGRFCLEPQPCTSLWDCPSGTLECKNGKCFTDMTSIAQTKSFCADAPPLGHDDCFPQLTSYQISVNAGFHVTGTASGAFDEGTTNVAAGTWKMTDDAGMPLSPTDEDKQCRPYAPKERDPRLVSRIPLRPRPGAAMGSNECGADVFKTDKTANQTTNVAQDGYHMDRFDARIQPSVIDGKEVPVLFTAGTAMSAKPEAPQLVDWMKGWTKDITAPNACSYLGGPLFGDPPSSPDPTTRQDRLQHARVRFRNTQVAFVLTNIDRAPGSGSTIHFEVHGGFRPQAVLPLPTVEVSAPARLVLGPVDSIPKDAVNTAAANYFFVVDQRRLGRSQGGGPTRGQIVRVSPFGYATANGNQPIYEDYQRSGNLFPIQ